MIIDMHTHDFGGEVDALSASAKRNQVDSIVLLCDVFRFGYAQNPQEITIINDGVADAARRCTVPASAFCYLNPGNSAEANRAEIERCFANPVFKGVKLEISCNCRSPHMDPIMHELQMRNKPLLQHCWYKSEGLRPGESDPADVAYLARRFPNVRIIMAHLCGCGYRGIEEIADCPNVWVDTSGGQPEYGFLEYAVKRIGAERILFGSDAPGRDICCQLTKVFEADITDSQKEMILWRNTKELLQL